MLIILLAAVMMVSFMIACAARGGAPQSPVPSSPADHSASLPEPRRARPRWPKPRRGKPRRAKRKRIWLCKLDRSAPDHLSPGAAGCDIRFGAYTVPGNAQPFGGGRSVISLASPFHRRGKASARRDPRMHSTMGVSFAHACLLPVHS